jgi:catechol 2,3-dioxygenase-like lactoylglutathione lyase family enzyme
MTDIGFTHVALFCRDVDKTAAFYKKYARMTEVHRRTDAATGHRVVWLSDTLRPFVTVFIEADTITPVLGPFAHLGVGCANRSEVDDLCAQAEAEGVLAKAPEDSGPPIGYWAMIKDPDGHMLELSHGQEIAFAVTDSALSHFGTR